MIYRNNTRRFLVLALMLALVLFGNLPFKSGISAPAAAAPPPSAVAGSPVTDKETRARAAESFGKLPLYFVENRGQIDKRVNYYVQGSDKTIYFTNQGLTFLLNSKPEAQRWSLKLDFVGARPGVRPEGRAQTGATFSYFRGRRSQWQAGLKSYSEIVYRELWPGIDLVYAGTVNQMKYTFVVKPGADPNRIKLAWRGASGVKLNAAGELEVTTPAGGFTDQRPVSWQETNGQQVDVTTKYRIEEKGKRKQSSNAAITYGFELGEYDRNRELVIDPAVLVYCGFIGGNDQEEGRSIAVDSAGNAYVTGFTESTEATFPVTVGPDLTYDPGGQSNAFVAKVNAGGTALVYCGYIGGSGLDEGNGIAVDSAGNAYVTGITTSTEASFPVTVGPDLTYNGLTDGFVLKVNASGTALDYCGYIGGSGFERGSGIVVDSTGNAYVSGDTTSTEADFPVTIGPDLTFNDASGEGDAFVAKVNAGGTALVYCGYIGGSERDLGEGIAVDSAGNAYIIGSTFSTEASFPVTVGPDLTQNGGFGDAFVAKVNAGGTTLVYCGYIGGSDLDRARGIAVDSAGNAYVTGDTGSTEASFPVTVGPDLTYNGSFTDGFVAKVNASGTALVYCGYIGGSDTEDGAGIAVDSVGNAYVAGSTNSTEADFPVTVGPDLTHNGSRDAFVAKVNVGGTALVYCGYIGGSSFDFTRGMAVDSAGSAYVTGRVLSTEADLPVTAGPDLTFNGDSDAFVAKISTCDNNCAKDALFRVIDGPSGLRNNFTGTVGNKFTVSANVRVGQLGFEDQLLNGLASSHQVGLWNSSGTLLASVTVQAGTGSELIGNWRYETLPTPVTLTAGSTYIIGAHVTNGGDAWTDNGATPVDFAINPPFSLGSPPNVFATSSFVFPTLNGTLAPLRWAPANMLLTTCFSAELAVISAAVQGLTTTGTLTQNQGDGLINKLSEVNTKLEQNQTGAAINQLNSFSSQVNAFINNGSLTPSQGQALIDAANAIKVVLACP